MSYQLIYSVQPTSNYSDEFLTLLKQISVLHLDTSIAAKRVCLTTVNQEQNCKQCRSWWDGSLWAVSSGFTLFAKVSVFVYRAERAMQKYLMIIQQQSFPKALLISMFSMRTRTCSSLDAPLRSTSNLYSQHGEIRNISMMALLVIALNKALLFFSSQNYSSQNCRESFYKHSHCCVFLWGIKKISLSTVMLFFLSQNKGGIFNKLS